MAKKQTKVKTRCHVEARHNYSTDELRELSQDLVGAMNTAESAEESAKAVSADYRAQAKTAKAKMTELRNKITNGYELKQVEATVEFDRKKGEKTYRYHCPGKPDHGKVIRREQMTEDDYARLPGMEEPPEPKKPEPAAEPAEEPAEAGEE